MKKLILAFILLSCGLAHAEREDNWGNSRPAMWRASFSITNDNIVLISTGHIHLHAVMVGSFTVGTESYISFFNSTTTNRLSNNVATATYINTSQLPAGSQPDSYTPLDMYFSSGLVYNKGGVPSTNGAASVTIFWDYVAPKDLSKSFIPWKP